MRQRVQQSPTSATPPWLTILSAPRKMLFRAAHVSVQGQGRWQGGVRPSADRLDQSSTDKHKTNPLSPAPLSPTWRRGVGSVWHRQRSSSSSRVPHPRHPGGLRAQLVHLQAGPAAVQREEQAGGAGGGGELGVAPARRRGAAWTGALLAAGCALTLPSPRHSVRCCRSGHQHTEKLLKPLAPAAPPQPPHVSSSSASHQAQAAHAA